jgi:hypothetical protein
LSDKVRVTVSKWGQDVKYYTVELSGNRLEVFKAMCDLNDLELESYRADEWRDVVK